MPLSFQWLLGSPVASFDVSMGRRGDRDGPLPLRRRCAHQIWKGSVRRNEGAAHFYNRLISTFTTTLDADLTRAVSAADPPLLVGPHHAPTMAVSGIPYDDDNVFKKIIEGTVPSYKIFETEHALAFLDAFPMVKGHSLLIPKAVGYASIIDMPADVAANVVKSSRLARVVKEATGCDGVNIVQNNGAWPRQVVFPCISRAPAMGTGQRRTCAPGQGERRR